MRFVSPFFFGALVGLSCARDVAVCGQFLRDPALTNSVAASHALGDIVDRCEPGCA